MKTLSAEEISRYSRQLLLPEIGIAGQQKLKKAKVLVVGAGGLGSPVALYLTAAGVGNIGILDFDSIDLSNLQRQIIHTSSDIGKQKALNASEYLKDLNPLVKIKTYNAALTNKNALDIIKEYQIVADCSDNFQTRYLVNDSCFILNKLYVYGAVLGLKGQASVFMPQKGCYRCLYPQPPVQDNANCLTKGVLGTVPGVIGSIMANEVLKLIINKKSEISKSLIGRLLLFNTWEATFNELKITKDKNCALCGEKPSIKNLVDYDKFCGISKIKKSKLQPCLNII